MKVGNSLRYWPRTIPLRRYRHFLSIVLLVAFSSLTQAQEPITVTGKVLDSLGVGLPNVTVSEKGTQKKSITDMEGSFSINVASQRTVLVFSSVGYLQKEIQVGNNTQLEVIMEESSTSMDEVVVVGYGTQKKQSLTGSVSTITSDDIARVHGGSTVSTTLAGKLPGVSFRMPDGRPGASANVQIRGMGDALFVIDGIQQDAGQFNNLAPNDIESISVLKDASAAIYGMRAANGVVVVTTKKGRANSGNRINVDAFMGFQNWTRFPKVLNNSYDYMKYRAEAEMNRYGTTIITPEELEKYREGTELGYQSFNWKDFIIKPNAPMNSFNINATGGTDKLNYYISATNLYQNSPLGREYLFKRTNIQSNVNAKVGNGLKLGMMVNGRIETRENPGVPGTDDYWLARFAILRNTPLKRPYANDNPDYLNDIQHNETNWAYLNYKHAGKYKDDWRVLQANFSAEYDIPWVKGLSINGMYSYYLADRLLNNHEYTYKTYTYRQDTDEYVHTGGSTNPWRERDQRKVNNITTQLQLNYKRSFGLHDVAFTFVNERISNTTIRNWIHSVPSSNTLPLIYFNTADTYTDEDFREARVGYIARLNYAYDDKYLLELSGRRDASYIFPPDNRVGYFPSVSAAWRISEESFMKNLLGSNTIVDDIKIRASYGILGDDGTRLGLGAFRYIAGYDYNQGIAILDGATVVGSRDRGVPTTNITWLKSAMRNIAVDFAFFNSKLTGSVEYFHRKRSGLIRTKDDVLVPQEIGYSLPMENLETDAQYGQELALSYNEMFNKVAFRVSGNITYSRSKFLTPYNPMFFNSWDKYRSANENRFTKIMWGYETIGQFQSFEEINNYPVNIDGRGNRTLVPGDLIYKDFNNDGVINGYDERPIGYAEGNLPNLNFGFSIGLAYNGFDFTADFSGGAGYSWSQNWETRWAFQNDGNLNRIFEDRWHRTDPYDLNSEWVPGRYPANRFNESGHSNNNRNSTYWVHNLRYLRARTFELGYTMPAHWLAKVKMQRARVYANVYNLFSIDNMKEFGLDPEVNEANGLQFPQSRVVNFGVNLSF